MSAKRPLKIVFTGPESSGKTTITKLAATTYQTNWLPEYARTYLNQLNRPYIAADLVNIAAGQLHSEQQFIQKYPNQDFLFLDTSLLVIKIWSIFKYGFYNFKLEQLLQQNLPDIFFLCDWQIPWEFDPLREAPNDRGVLYDLYKKELVALEVPFFELKGSEMERLDSIKSILPSIK